MRRYLLLILIYVVAWSCNSNNDKSGRKPQLTDITESVYASVTIKPVTTYYPRSIQSGVIDQIYTKEGALVKKGQLLFQVQPNIADQVQLSNAKINLEEARANYLGQNSQLKSIELDIQSAREQYQLDSLNFKRQGRLISQNLGKRIDYDQMKLKYENAKKQLEVLEQKLEQTKLKLASNYKKAKNNLAIERDQLIDFKVRAKMDGKIYALYKEVGDLISSQENVLEIGSADKFKIAMDIDEVDIIKIQLGDSVLIVLDAYPTKVFEAEVSKIFDKKNSTTQTFRVEAVFKKVPPKLYFGLSGEANIIIARRVNTLVIPTEYLLPSDKVLTPQGEIEVKLGVKNLEFAEILSGIDTSFILLKPNE